MISYEIPESSLDSKKRITIQDGVIPNNVVVVITDGDKCLGSIIIRKDELEKIQ